MDRISELSDELLIEILSRFPTKDAISTCKLSKRWKCLWIAPVIQSFRLNISVPRAITEDVKTWLAIATSRSLRELDVSYCCYPIKPGKTRYDPPGKHGILPLSLYACRSLVVLKLSGHILMNVPRRMVCLPSLKTLQLREVSGLHGKSLGRLLSICPVIENLLVDFSDRLEIDTPSLKYLRLEDGNDENESCLIENMPELEEAYVDVRYPDIQSLVGSIQSVKHLTICSKALYGDGFVFRHLEELKLCDCSECSSMLLSRLLTDSPNLRVLNIFQMRRHDDKDMVLWNRPSHVPACFESSLETFIWSGYLGRQQERKIAVYILKRDFLLKTARISYVVNSILKLKMLKDFAESSRASSKCKLFFD
ncbi:unnamed protein product [Microthlaspi erraticum]|uniref:FBD domain-containing protein n=1 Tax=Microthlaspi erraticum TaxID=1685480 RepID=A0A6D2I2T0_9BRAS|nr:unnamed protein product [Microthlaspi erraticum]